MYLITKKNGKQFFFCRPTDSTFKENEKKFGQPNFFLFLIYRPTDSTKMARHKSAILKINRPWPRVIQLWYHPQWYQNHSQTTLRYFFRRVRHPAPTTFPNGIALISVIRLVIILCIYRNWRKPLYFSSMCMCRRCLILLFCLFE